MSAQDKRSSQVWLITGCSTGIGRAVAQSALEAGDRVALTARDPSTLRDLVAEFPARSLALRLDVTAQDQIEAAVGEAETTFGRLDVLVNNAGYGYVGAVEEGVDEDVRKMFDTNFFGAVALIKAVLPGMRARRAGFIVNMSSTTGFVPNPGNIYYSTSKFALESLSEGLAKELEPFGIRVSAIEPGIFRSDWSSRSMQESPRRIADYEATVGVRRELIRLGPGPDAGDPRRIGAAIVMLSRLAEPPVHLLLGSDVLEAVRAKLEALDESIAEWEPVTLGGELPTDRS
ncbi:MAG: short-chain dehydrogenase/reductase [Deltaproteobacteria bacterium]|jgi:NAD(P)-dependent dehydrogenase (short-subunit alcohol dehydrogenase family)|nr:short-chain dehydrogenase/reductase [Deltaproteobacteria bacterium]